MSRLWQLTGEVYCLQVQRQQYNVKANWIYRGNFQITIFWLIINIFRQCFIGSYVRRCTCDSQSEIFQGCGWCQLGCVSGIHMSGIYFWLGVGTGVRLGRMIGGIWSYHCVQRYVCACLSVCTWDMSEGYKSLGTILLEVPCFYWCWGAILL